jgi:hypothetical protein
MRHRNYVSHDCSRTRPSSTMLYCRNYYYTTVWPSTGLLTLLTVRSDPDLHPIRFPRAPPYLHPTGYVRAPYRARLHMEQFKLITGRKTDGTSTRRKHQLDACTLTSTSRHRDRIELIDSHDGNPAEQVALSCQGTPARSPAYWAVALDSLDSLEGGA